MILFVSNQSDSKIVCVTDRGSILCYDINWKRLGARLTKSNGASVCQHQGCFPLPVVKENKEHFFATD